MRTKKALKNAISSIMSYMVLTAMVFIVQRVFKDTLGVEYIGLDGLFNNIISCLAIAELGFGSAIVVNLYKPVRDNNIPEIKALMGFYKKIYRYIAIVVFVLGMIILPFVEKIVGTVQIPLNIKLLYLLYLFDVVVSYFVTYKRSILYANQQNYYITAIHTVVAFTTYILRILVLLMFKNYYLYIFTSVLMRLIENIVINILVNKIYPYIKDKDVDNISEQVKDDIFKKVKGLFFHKIASFIVNGTDNIIIAMVPGLGVVMVGIYSSYTIITEKLIGIITTVFGSITSSVGNLLVEGDREKNYTIFTNLNYVISWVYIFSSISLYYVSFPFVEIWMGKDMVLDSVTVFIISLKLFVSGIRMTFSMFKEAAGVFYEDRYVPIIESVLNLVLSIPMAFAWGLKGVLIGTICSTMLLYVYTYPKYVYGIILNKDIKIYCKDMFVIIVRFVLCFVSTQIVMGFINCSNVFVQLAFTLMVCVFVPNIIMIIMTNKSKEFVYFKTLALSMIKRKS